MTTRNTVEGQWTETSSVPQVDLDGVIEKYAAELQKIYDNHTAGEYTFIGVVSEILRAAGA